MTCMTRDSWYDEWLPKNREDEWRAQNEEKKDGRRNKAMLEYIRERKWLNNQKITVKDKGKVRHKKKFDSGRGRNNRSCRVDEQPIRLPDELQLNHNPQNGDKHSPVSPVCLPRTPLNDCKHWFSRKGRVPLGHFCALDHTTSAVLQDNHQQIMFG